MSDNFARLRIMFVERTNSFHCWLSYDQVAQFKETLESIYPGITNPRGVDISFSDWKVLYPQITSLSLIPNPGLGVVCDNAFSYGTRDLEYNPSRGDQTPFLLLRGSHEIGYCPYIQTDPPHLEALQDHSTSIRRSPRKDGIVGVRERCFVSGRIRAILERQNFRGLSFIPTVKVNYRQSSMHPDKVGVVTPESWGSTPADAVYWEIRSTRYLPLISRYHTKMQPMGDTGLLPAQRLLPHDAIGPIDFANGANCLRLRRYFTNAVDVFHDLDVAQSVEYGPAYGQPGAYREIYVSHRFREFCESEGIKARYYPVRIDDPDVVRGWAEDVPPWIASSPVWNYAYTGETKPGVERNW